MFSDHSHNIKLIREKLNEKTILIPDDDGQYKVVTVKEIKLRRDEIKSQLNIHLTNDHF